MYGNWFARAMVNGGAGARVAAPVFSPAAGAYGPTQNVTITSATVGATIYYTTDGSEPTALSTAYTVPVAIAATATLKAIAIDGVLADSAVTSGTYTINGAVATPTFSPVAGTYGTTQNVTITSATSGAAIYYTTDGSTPDATDTLYTTPVAVAATATLKAIGIKTAYSDSAVGEAAYVISAGPPATNLLKHWKLNTGLTQAGGFASAWADEVAGTSLAQATGANQPAVQGDGSLLFDGASDYMQATFTLGQPCTVYLLMKQVTWTSARDFCDGKNLNSGVIQQKGVTPQLDFYSGGFGGANGNFAVNTYGVVAAVWNSPTSVLQVDATAAVTGNSGVSTMGGFTLAAGGNGGSLTNIQVKEVLIYDVAHDATQRGTVRDYLATV